MMTRTRKHRARVNLYVEAARRNTELMAAIDVAGDALRTARGTLMTAIRAGVDLPDFDAAEHATVKKIDAALAALEFT
jgi:hypothetical protein